MIHHAVTNSGPRGRCVLRRLIGLWLVLALSGFAGVASADDAKEQAKVLFAEGRTKFKAKNYEAALTAFEKANAIKPHPVMLLNIGQVYEAMGRLPDAVNYYKQFVTAGPPAAKAEAVKQRVRALLTTMKSSWGVVRITSNPPGAEVRLDDPNERPRGITPADVALPAGRCGPSASRAPQAVFR